MLLDLVKDIQFRVRPIRPHASRHKAPNRHNFLPPIPLQNISTQIIGLQSKTVPLMLPNPIPKHGIQLYPLIGVELNHG